MTTYSSPHGEDLTMTDGSILVGHDGSEGADRALALALELAEALRGRVTILRTWQIGYPPAKLLDDGYVLSFPEVSARERAALVLGVGRLRASHPTVEVDYLAALGRPAETLVLLSESSRMIVVGSRGLGGFAAATLGSVSERCVRHAFCPVLVSRPPRTDHGVDR
ncbi:universal stress protein [Herbiconiux sp. CPCC 203407]|uniref:Universal stress protein n=1 Tax=Herbiconiux oxytropis TaxID=2970915 RepID=A0AA42BVS8_9MICO|nr:universal stress protein [Herbiconiux oxytropis]MCS5724146.1 universal stress protein [Herbiconiux oxytropis]MCS5726919.1 universal stress protein [Herbiconiux oxytropis]